VHCDLAVRNLLVAPGTESEKYLVKVTDFGLSKIMSNEQYSRVDDKTVRGFSKVFLRFLGVASEMVRA
jgi:tRNA A-37 threonylcarbamoyl transferase component Bud32